MLLSALYQVTCVLLSRLGVIELWQRLLRAEGFHQVTVRTKSLIIESLHVKYL